MLGMSFVEMIYLFAFVTSIVVIKKKKTLMHPPYH